MKPPSLHCRPIRLALNPRKWSTSVPTTNPQLLHLSSTKTTVAIRQTDLAIPLRCRFPAHRDAQMPLMDSLNGNTPWSLVIRNRTADSMAGSGRE